MSGESGSLRRLELQLSEEAWTGLTRIAQELGADDLSAVAHRGLLDWIGARTAELDNRDPAQKYFVNEALDELLKR